MFNSVHAQSSQVMSVLQSKGREEGESQSSVAKQKAKELY
jgi:hypothetical protein